MGESYKQQIYESRSEEDKKAEAEAKYRNKKDGRGFIKGLFNKDKKPMRGVDIAHEQATWEDAARRNLAGREKTGPVLIAVDEKTGTYRRDKTDAEKMRAVREDINKILPDNFVKELTRMKELRVANPNAYTMFLNEVFLQANGGEDVWGRKSSSPAREFKGWTAEDCQELLKDLGEDMLLGGINNKSESKPAKEK